jgi:Bacterial PH domain
MGIQSHGHEHELEPEHGLPEPLPKGERMLWQGSPQFGALALRVFHLRKVALYFALLMAWRASGVVADGGGFLDTLSSLALPMGVALLGLAALSTLAWLTARTAVYTLTDKRLVMRIGIVLTLTFNIPLRSIRWAAIGQNKQADGVGDIVIALNGPDHIAWLHLWPHARPWRMAKPEPMLCSVPQAAQLAAQLTAAWQAAMATTPAVMATPAAERSPALGQPPVQSLTSVPTHRPVNQPGWLPIAQRTPPTLRPNNGPTTSHAGCWW